MGLALVESYFAIFTYTRLLLLGQGQIGWFVCRLRHGKSSPHAEME